MLSLFSFGCSVIIKFVVEIKCMDDLCVAFHEAGHVSVYELFGWEYKYVEIDEKGDGKVSGGYEGTNAMLDELILAFICFSGGIAEALFLSSNRGYEAVDLSKFLKYFGEPDSPDSMDLLYAHLKREGGGADVSKYQKIGLHESYRNPLLKFTGEIIIDNWSVVSIIANYLAERKRLTAKEVKKLLSDSRLRELGVLKLKYIKELKELRKKYISERVRCRFPKVLNDRFPL